MFKKVAEFRILPPWHAAPGTRHMLPANDNRAGVRPAEVWRATRPRPVCRWSLTKDTNRLACRWELDAAYEPKRLLRAQPPAIPALQNAVLKLSRRGQDRTEVTLGT